LLEKKEVWRFQHSWFGRRHLFRIFRTRNSASANFAGALLGRVLIKCAAMSAFGGILLQKLVVSHGWGHSLSF
jgi:hypothetical protein